MTDLAPPPAARLGAIVLTVDEPSGGWATLGHRAAQLEAAGAESLWVTDHLLWPTPCLDAQTAVTVLATATTAATVGTAVLQLPLREPAAVAKAAASLEALAPGRTVLGLGIGEHRWEFEAVGLGDRFARRGALLDEGIGRIRRCWDHPMTPGGPVPIWLGGRSAPALARAAAVADGWVPHLCSLAWYEARVVELGRLVADADRPADAVRRAVVVAAFVDGPDGSDPTVWLARLFATTPDQAARRLVRGSAAAVAAELRRFVDAGAEDVILMIASDQPIPHLAAIREHLPR